MGLLLTHKRTVVRVFSDMVTVSEEKEGGKGGGKRGEIATFSRQSRYRLFRLLHTLRFRTFSFVTLTYGNTFPEDPRQAKVHLKAFRRATERRWGAIRAIWRMEFQERQAPHFHIIYLDPPFIPVQDWNILWDKCRKSPVSERFGNSLDLTVPKGNSAARLIGKYVAKYIAKVDERGVATLPGNPGRMWGRWNIEDEQPETFTLSSLEAFRLAKVLIPGEETLGWHPFDQKNYTVFGGNMGTNAYQKEIEGILAGIFTRTRPVKRDKVTYVTSNLEGSCV